MGRTKPEMLKDLREELEAIRSLTGLAEKKPGTFYLGKTPFLHFHDREGKRWADVKAADGKWEKVEVDFDASPRQRGSFLKSVRFAHAAISVLQERR